MSEKERILEAAKKRFLNAGFYKTSVEELANELGMSKKTIYKYFQSKEEIIETLIFMLLNQMIIKVEEEINSGKNAVEKFGSILKIIIKNVMAFGDRWVSDLQRFTPKLWNKIDEFRAKLILKNLTKIVEQGKNEGLIKDIPTTVYLTMAIASIRAVINPEFLTKNDYTFKQGVSFVFEIMFKSALTEKGLKLVKNFDIGDII